MFVCLGVIDRLSLVYLLTFNQLLSPRILTEFAMYRVVVLTLVTVVGTVAAGVAFGGCDTCEKGLRCQFCDCDCCCPCEVRRRTVMVPMCVTETRMKVKIVKEMKERQETYTVFERVPEKRTYSKECCYIEAEVITKEITKECCRRVKNDVTLEDTYRTPVIEFHKGVRCREIRTECGKVCVEEPCTYKVVRTEEHPRARNCKREDVVFEECKKTIDYCVKTPKFEKKVCGVETVYKLKPVERQRTVQVCVPKAIKVPVDIKVNRMVAQQICCCDQCWRGMNEQRRKKQKRADHKKKLIAFANPVENTAKALSYADAAIIEGPKKLASRVTGFFK